MSHGSWVAACDVAAVPVSRPTVSTAVVPAARIVRRARRIHGRTGMDELLHRVRRRDFAMLALTISAEQSGCRDPRAGIPALLRPSLWRDADGPSRHPAELP